MMHRSVQALIGRAIVDKDFRNQLLNGRRELALAQFDLTDEEKQVICSIEAQSFEEFAREIHAWIELIEGKAQRRPLQMAGLLL